MSARVNVSKTILDSGTFPHAAILSLGIQKSEMTGCKGAFLQEKVNY